MMWQVASGSYYNRINEALPYSHYLEKAKNLMNSSVKDRSTREHKEYFAEISRVCYFF